MDTRSQIGTAFLCDYQELVRDWAEYEGGRVSPPPLERMTLNDIPQEVLSVQDAQLCQVVVVFDPKAPPTRPRAVVVKGPIGEDGVIINQRRFNLALPE